jgi:putative colanic acid biosynthesis acetyltransferase WcaF
MFGAQIGHDVHIHPTVRIAVPWNLSIGDAVAVGDHAILYSLGRITLGPSVSVSQYAHLCAGTHDYRRRDLPLLKPPITVSEGAWICAEAFVGPRVVVGPFAIVGARAVVTRDVEAWTIMQGNPARKVGPRQAFRDT